MGQADGAVGMLKGIGYVTVRVPRANLKPLQVFEKTGNTLVERGHITDLFQTVGNTHPPQIESNEELANINGQRTSTLKIGVGLTILGGIIKAMGGNLGFGTTFSRAKTATFEFTDVEGDKINVFNLERFLSVADLDHSLPNSIKLLDADKLYVVTAVAKAKKISFEIDKTSETENSLDVPVIQQIVGGNVKVTQSTNNKTKITFEGNQKLVFGVKAVQMVFKDGNFQLLKQAKPGDAALESITFEEEENKEELAVLTTGGPFIKLEMSDM